MRGLTHLEGSMLRAQMLESHSLGLAYYFLKYELSSLINCSVTMHKEDNTSSSHTRLL